MCLGTSHRCLVLTLGGVWISAQLLAQVLKDSFVLQFGTTVSDNLCTCWEAGPGACGKHSGKFLDSLVPRQAARCWQAECEFLFETWAPQLRVCRCWRLWLALALCRATCILRRDYPCCPVLVYVTHLAAKKRPYQATAGQIFLLAGQGLVSSQDGGFMQRSTIPEMPKSSASSLLSFQDVAQRLSLLGSHLWIALHL